MVVVFPVFVVTLVINIVRISSQRLLRKKQKSWEYVAAKNATESDTTTTTPRIIDNRTGNNKRPERSP